MTTPKVSWLSHPRSLILPSLVLGDEIEGLFLSNRDEHLSPNDPLTLGRRAWPVTPLALAVGHQPGMDRSVGVRPGEAAVIADQAGSTVRGTSGTAPSTWAAPSPQRSLR